MPDRLLLDAMLGKLARYLRMCGYDAAYALDRGVEADDGLREIAASEGRRLLTRDVDLAARTRRGAASDEPRAEAVSRGESTDGDASATTTDGPPEPILLETRAIEDQLREVQAAGYELTLAARPARCGDCNGAVERVEPSADRPAYVPDERTDVWRCVDCGQHFWKGGHWDRVAETLANL